MERKPFLRSGLITLLAGISITAAFAATGFIAAFGREQLLGVSLSDWSVQTLTILAGRCAADSFFLVLNIVVRHWVMVTLAFAIVGAAIVVLRHRTLPGWVAPAAECVLAIPLLVWVITVIVKFEAPTVALRGWVLASDQETPLSTAVRQLHPRPSVVAKSTTDYIRAAAASSSDAPGVTRLLDYYFLNQKDTPGVLLLESSSDRVALDLKSIGFRYRNRDQARNQLLATYARAVLVCGLALLYVLLSAQCPESKFWSDLLIVLRTALIVTSAVAAVLVPYVYGKVVDATLFPNAHIAYLVPSTVSADQKPDVVSSEYPVLSQTDKAVSLLSISRGGGYTKIIEVPREKILRLDFNSEVDALAKISACVANSTEQGECQ
jgi:hypothetical protein